MFIVKDVITTGKEFPPRRLTQQYNTMGNYSDYIVGQFRNLSPDATIRVNYFAQIRDVWMDIVASNEPVITPEPPEEWNMAEIIRELVGDLVAYGRAVLHDTQIGPQVISPQFYFPIREPWNDQIGDVDIVAYPFSTQETDAHIIDRIAKYKYENGTCNFTIYNATLASIGGPLSSENFAASSPITLELENRLGMFAKIEDIVKTIHMRMSDIDRANSKASDPHLVLPASIFDVDDAGNFTVDKEGMVLPVESRDFSPGYLTWDFVPEAQYMELKDLRTTMYTLCELSSFLFNEEGVKSGNFTSAAAVRRLATPTAIFGQEVRDKIDELIYILLPETQSIDWEVPILSTVVEDEDIQGKDEDDNKLEERDSKGASNASK